MNEKTFVYRTPNLLTKPIKRHGEFVSESLIKLLAVDEIQAQNKYLEYVRYGKKIGWYK